MRTTFAQKGLPATETPERRTAAGNPTWRRWLLIVSLAPGEKTMNSLRQLQDCGQSIWLDYIRRDLITSGQFRRLVEEDGVHGVTSNPTIFDKAIAAGTAYDDALRLLLAADPDRDALTLFEKLEIEDLQMAADMLRPVYDQTEGADGFVKMHSVITAGCSQHSKRESKTPNRRWLAWPSWVSTWGQSQKN